MIGKRIIANILNRAILFIPSILFVSGVALVINPNYFIFGNDGSSGWLVLFLYKYMLFLPVVFIDLVRLPSEWMQIMAIILPTLLSLMMLEVITIRLIKADLGMKIFGLQIKSTKNNALTLMQIIIRTIIKYFSLAFFPFALLYVFLNKERMTVYDKLSSTEVVRTQK